MGSLTLITAPEDALPIDLDRFKAQARLGLTTEDDLLTSYLKAAVAYLDGRDGLLGRALMTQTWELALDRWPTWESRSRPDWIEIPLPPLQSVTSITYVDDAGATQTWASTNYQVDIRKQPGRIVRAYNTSWPTLRGGDQINQVIVKFVAGYGASPANVPEDIRHAISILAAHWYERRTLLEPMALYAAALTFDALTDKYRVNRFGRA